ncbi:hypothetical protein BC829DRAFT_291555 [Chytridium lagenaria]|nr:hypothetical protein BC829DRAFT_291555 [Chytridium lagenaria]
MARRRKKQVTVKKGRKKPTASSAAKGSSAPTGSMPPLSPTLSRNSSPSPTLSNRTSSPNETSAPVINSTTVATPLSPQLPSETIVISQPTVLGPQSTASDKIRLDTSSFSLYSRSSSPEPAGYSSPTHPKVGSHLGRFDSSSFGGRVALPKTTARKRPIDMDEDRVPGENSAIKEIKTVKPTVVFPPRRQGLRSSAKEKDDEIMADRTDIFGSGQGFVTKSFSKRKSGEDETEVYEEDYEARGRPAKRSRSKVEEEDVKRFIISGEVLRSRPGRGLGMTKPDRWVKRTVILSESFQCTRLDLLGFY